MAPLSKAQEIVLISLSSFSGALSMCGSVCIIILATKRRERGTYHRLLMALSVFDMIHSLVNICQPFLLPASSERIWTIGNDRTCSMVGFFNQLSTTVSIYNVVLNLHYLLTIRYGIEERMVEKWIEPFMHGLAILFPLGTGLYGVTIGLYSEMELGAACWISDFPRGCEEDPNVECTGQIYGWLFSGVPLLLSVVFLLVSNILIYLKVWSIVTKARRFSRTGEPDNFRRRRQDVATQASLYVAACFNTVMWLVVVRTLESMGVHSESESSVFHILVLTSFFYPLQGFWNLLIYVRPRYMRWRRRSPEEGRWWAFRQAIHPNPMNSSSFVSSRSRSSLRASAMSLPRRTATSENHETPDSGTFDEAYLNDHLAKLSNVLNTQHQQERAAAAIAAGSNTIRSGGGASGSIEEPMGHEQHGDASLEVSSGGSAISLQPAREFSEAILDEEQPGLPGETRGQTNVTSVPMNGHNDVLEISTSSSSPPMNAAMAAAASVASLDDDYDDDDDGNGGRFG